MEYLPNRVFIVVDGFFSHWFALLLVSSVQKLNNLPPNATPDMINRAGEKAVREMQRQGNALDENATRSGV